MQVGVALACYAATHSLPSGYLPPPGMTTIVSGYIFWGFVMLVCVFAPYLYLTPPNIGIRVRFHIIRNLETMHD